MRSTFEEKTYESYFNNELNRHTEIYFPPGQVQEGSLGFDCSAYSKSHRLWSKIGYPYFFKLPFYGCDLRDIADEMETYLRIQLNNIPKIRANLLFQYKKPEYIMCTTGKEWDIWNQPYYRYDIYSEQQDLLMKIHSAFGHKVLVMYAAPALHKVDDLVNAHVSSKIIDSSNFRKVEELNHHRNTYTKSGTYSIACSEIEKIKNFDLIELLENDLTDSEYASQANEEIIVEFINKIVYIVNKNIYFKDSFSKLNEHIGKVKSYELFYSILIMRNLKQLVGTQWFLKL